MKTDKEIIAQLHTLQLSVVPSEKLQKRIALLGQHLPGHTSALGWFGSYGPALVLAALLLMIGTGSQIMLSANQSKPGSFLYPVKKAVIQTQIHFTQSPIEKQKLQEEILEVTPTATPTPTPTVAPTKTPEKEHEKKDVRGAHFPEIQISLTPVPQENAKHHGNSHGEDNSSDQYFFNQQEDGDRGGSILLINHEF